MIKTNGYICDRCGKTKEKGASINMPFRDRIIDSVGWIDICSKSGYKRDVDLCQDCLNDFNRWFREKRES